MSIHVVCGQVEDVTRTRPRFETDAVAPRCHENHTVGLVRGRVDGGLRSVGLVDHVTGPPTIRVSINSGVNAVVRSPFDRLTIDEVPHT